MHASIVTNPFKENASTANEVFWEGNVARISSQTPADLWAMGQEIAKTEYLKYQRALGASASNMDT